MSSDFKTVLQKDPAIADITSDLVYAVKSGGSATTYQAFPSTSSTNSVIVFNIQIPSENIIVARDAILQAPLQFTMNVSNVPAQQQALAWGQTASLQAFPLASLMTTATATINNTTTSVNLQDVLPQILQLNSNRELYRFNGMTPSLPDNNWGLYSDSFAANSSPLAAYSNQSYDNDQSPRGAFPCYVQIDRFIAGVWQDNSNISTGAANETWRVTVFTAVSEPLFLSPFIYADPCHNKQGMLGINNMSFTFNINATLNRLVSCFVPAGAVVTIAPGVLADPNPAANLWIANPNLFQNQFSLPAFQLQNGGPTMRLRLLSSQPSDHLETRNVIPYYDLPRYLTANANNGPLAAGASQTIISQSIQLSQLPDYFIIVARKPVGNQAITDSSSFLGIKSISMNLNNQSGLLSSASQQDLWRMSVKNGSQQSFKQFQGCALKYTQDGAGELVPTTGAMFVVSPTDLSLPDYLTSGSLGAFQLQFNLGVYNQFPDALNAVEICVIAANSGIFVIQQGTANVYTGILTREAVLAAKSQESTQQDDRMIGGFQERGMVRHPRQYRMKSGGAMSAGAMSAGAMSGGRSRLTGMY